MHPLSYNFKDEIFHQDTKEDMELLIELIENHNAIICKLEETSRLSKLSLEGKKYINDFLSQCEILTIKDRSNRNELLRKSKQTIFLFDKIKIEVIKALVCEDSNYYLVSKSNVWTKKTQEEYNKLTKNGKKRYNRLTVVIANIIDYNSQRQIFYKLLKKTNINICSYCLTQYALLYESITNDKKIKKEWKMTAQLDHLLPKSEFPFLSVSMYNIFPVCSHCNNRKLTQKFDYNPLSTGVCYEWDFSKLLKLNKNRPELVFNNSESIVIRRVTGTSPTPPDKDLVETLEYNNLYKNFTPYISSFVERYKKYGSEGYKEGIVNSINSTSSEVEKKLIEEDKLMYFLTDSSLKEQDIFKYPLTKMKIELYKYIKSKTK